MKRLLEEMEKNQEMKAKIEELDKNPESTLKDFIKVAAEYGVELKEEDFKPAEGEFTDDELDTVAGGAECGCILGGGGSGTEYEKSKTCACVIGGGGEWENGDCRCTCVIGGSGDGKLFK